MKHTCGNRELRTSRLILALLSADDENYAQVVREIGDCVPCLQSIVNWLVALLAGSRALAAGSREAAAGFELDYLDQVLGIMHEPF